MAYGKGILLLLLFECHVSFHRHHALAADLLNCLDFHAWKWKAANGRPSRNSISLAQPHYIIPCTHSPRSRIFVRSGCATTLCFITGILLPHTPLKMSPPSGCSSLFLAAATCHQEQHYRHCPHPISVWKSCRNLRQYRHAYRVSKTTTRTSE